MLQTATEGGISDDSTLQRIEAHRDQLEAYEGLCRELGAKPAEVALAWLLRKLVVSTTILGATTTEELRADLDALTVQLDAEVAERLDRIWPGPGKPPGVRLVRPAELCRRPAWLVVCGDSFADRTVISEMAIDSHEFRQIITV